MDIKGKQDRQTDRHLPILEGPAKLVGVDGQLKSEIVCIIINVRKYFHHWVLFVHIATLHGYVVCDVCVYMFVHRNPQPKAVRMFVTMTHTHLYLGQMVYVCKTHLPRLLLREAKLRVHIQLRDCPSHSVLTVKHSYV